MDSVYQPSDFDCLLNDLCDVDWDNTSKESTLDSSSYSSSPVTVHNRKTVRLDSKGNRKVKIRNGDVAYDFEVHFPRPRIVSTDIRRSFGNMFVNVMNSGDFPLMFGFLNTFFSPNITRISRKTYVSESTPYKSSSQDGVLDIARHWYDSSRYAPDTVVSLNNTKLHTYSDGAESKLVTGIKLECTRIFDDKMATLLKNEPSLIESTVVSKDSPSYSNSSNNSNSGRGSGTAGFLMSSVYSSNSFSSANTEYTAVGNKRHSSDCIDSSDPLPASIDVDNVGMAYNRDSIHSSLSNLTLRERPVRLVGVGQLAIHFNANKSISKMVMNVKVDLEENYNKNGAENVNCDNE